MIGRRCDAHDIVAELERELVELETLSDPELDAVVVAAG